MKKLSIVIALILIQSTTAICSDLGKTTASSILSALQCQGDVLASFRDLEKKKAVLDKSGIHFSKIGEEMDEKITLKFKEPFSFFGAKSNLAEMYIDGGEFIAYADFEGDPELVIKKLALKQSDPDNKQDYVNLKGPNNCQPVQRLRKNGSGKYRFGCGWCNGG